MNTWLWIPIVVFAAASQTVRNASQKSLTKTAGTLAATFVRFAYGLPFSALGLGIVLSLPGNPLPVAGGAFAIWVFGGAIAQLAATALLLAAMEERTFMVALAYSKTDVLQIALFSALILFEPASPVTLAAIVLASAGVILMSVRPALQPGSLKAWFSSAALLGIASGACFALSAVCFRAAILGLGGVSPWLGGTYAVFWSQIVQSAVLGGYLLWRDRRGLAEVIRNWRVSLLAGLSGAASSMAWFTAFGMRNVVDVRTLGMVEMLFVYAASRLFFRERTTAREASGMLLLVGGLIVLFTQL